MKVSNRKKQARIALYKYFKSVCPNCRRTGGNHFVAPSFNEAGFYLCALTPPTKDK